MAMLKITRSHVHGKFPAVCQLKHSNAEGLCEFCVRALSFVGVADWKKLVRFGSDGTSIKRYGSTF